MPSPPYIRLREVTKTYFTFGSGAATGQDAESAGGQAGPTPAVNSVSMEIGDGTRLGIIGPNGAGKSTLLHMIAGVAEPTSGKIETTGKVTAIMTLGLGLREDFTGRENVYLEGQVQGRSREQTNVLIDEIVDFADIGEFIDYPLRTYSTGMKARLAFAMLTCLRPEILIIDEALSAGDARFSVKATRKIEQLCAAGNIVIVVSHGMGSIRAICNRCVWMDAGKIVMDGDPVTVTDAYIDAVRQADEAALLERFKSKVGHRSLRPGCEIPEFGIKEEGSAQARAIVDAGSNVAMTLQIRAPDQVRKRVAVRIERLDGLVVADSTLEDLDTRLPATAQEFGVSMLFEPLVLNYGIYRADASLYGGQEVLATHSIFFEIVVRDPPTGGRPALCYPNGLNVQKLG